MQAKFTRYNYILPAIILHFGVLKYCIILGTKLKGWRLNYGLRTKREYGATKNFNS
jgi:hypothetical protein